MAPREQSLATSMWLSTRAGRLLAGSLAAFAIGIFAAPPATADPVWTWGATRDYTEIDQPNSQPINMTGDGHHGYLWDVDRYCSGCTPSWDRWVAFLAASNGHAGLTTTFNNVVGPAPDDLCHVYLAVKGIRRDIDYRVEVFDEWHRVTYIAARADNKGEYDWADTGWFLHDGRTKFKVNVEIDVTGGSFADLRFDSLGLSCKRRGT
ncbi:hypothetical protein [Pseudonocardia sp. TRM90224]|uniref:hypothetical protein n=1 Tax=Pseudonocardia sp. TRM90224 TaxID=2812678 RepID=UPI001E453F43|nr:hypothetical protein [Pseudonocardia sp. TRM90224]